MPLASTRTRLGLEPLEARENPATVWMSEGFEQAFVPALPFGWVKTSSDGANAIPTAAGQGFGGTAGAVTAGGSQTTGLAWYAQRYAADAGASASVRVDSLVPAVVFARGNNLASSAPSYLAAAVTRGLTVELWEVTNGQVKVLGSVTSPAASYLSNAWVKLTLIPSGGSAAVQVTRLDNGQYLTPQGTWQAAATAAVTSAAVSLRPADGLVGFGRAAKVSGAVSFDNFEVLAPQSVTIPTVPVPPPPAPPPPPPPPIATSVSETFDTTATGARPADWSGVASDATGGFAASANKAGGTGNGFTSSGASVTTARAWANTALPADVEASAAVYLDSLIPVQVAIRGTNLGGTAPTYYAVSLTRGLEANLVRVVNGAETTLATVKSASYFSNNWLRARVVAVGDHLQVMLYRADTQQWLTAAGAWSGSPAFALDVRDGAITGGGVAGVVRKAAVAGAVTVDDFTAKPTAAASGPLVTIQAPPGSTYQGAVTFTASAAGPAAVTRIAFQLNGQDRAAAAGGQGLWVLDTTTLSNGGYTLTVQATDAAGNVGTATLAFAVNNPNGTPIPVPTIPRHYSHIRIAELAYDGLALGAYEQNLLRTSVDLVIPAPRYMAAIDAASPSTPQALYTNLSNLYQTLLTDWLSYADRTGVSRELAFYHVSNATPFTGSSASSQPVNRFWSVLQTPASGTGAPTDLTSAAYGGRAFNLNLGAAGQTTSFGFPDRFRELNVTLAKPAGGGWGGVWEYAAGTDAARNPVWKTLTLLQDGTGGFARTGTVTFDPPADWTAVALNGGAALFQVRFRVTDGAAALAPEAKTVLGRDYVGAAGGQSGTIPAFDYAADANGDGYLNDAEYARRAAGDDARFAYESRLFYPGYGQMRFVTNPSSVAVRAWAADYHARLLAANPLADGLFLDNAHGKLPFPGVSVLEPTASYSDDSGALVAAVARAIGPKFVLSNTANGATTADAITRSSGAVLEEFLIRAQDQNWSEFGDVSNTVARRLAGGPGYVVLDSTPAGGTATDPRTQLATLADYYLLADPDRTMLMFFGGSSPATSWTQHWSPAAAVDVGKPKGGVTTFATGTDPANAALTYKVFAREYDNALVLYKPLSYKLGSGEGTPADDTATTHQLSGNYRTVNADGTLGPVVSSVTLRNGEGAILVRA